MAPFGIPASATAALSHLNISQPRIDDKAAEPELSLDDCDLNSDDELSDISEAGLESIRQSLHSSKLQFSSPVGRDLSDNESEKNSMDGSDYLSDGSIDGEEKEELAVGARPPKRLKLTMHAWRTPDSQPANACSPASAQIQGLAPALTINQPLMRPTPSYVTEELSLTNPKLSRIAEQAADREKSRKELPPLLSPSLPPSLEAFVAAKSAPVVPTPGTHSTNCSLKMTIMPTSQFETLKSHNSILRSHNLSLSRQNTELRHDNAQAILLYQEVKDMGPMDHSACVRKDDYQEVVDENETLRTDAVRLQWEHQIMKECGFEWARLEIGWDTERDVLKKKIDDQAEECKELSMREVSIKGQLSETEARGKMQEARAIQAEHQVQQLRGVLEQERQGAVHLQAQVEQLLATAVMQKQGRYPCA